MNCILFYKNGSNTVQRVGAGIYGKLAKVDISITLGNCATVLERGLHLWNELDLTARQQ